jgi:hypothetical protein
MLDAGISAYVPSIFREKPELAEDFRGFTYFQNCVSFGSHTRIGAPPLFGGYEYEPRHIQQSRNSALKKHNEALLMLPRLFSGVGYQVTVTDPPFANYSLRPDLSIFYPFPEIHAQNIIGNYTGEWLRRNSGVDVISIERLVKNRLIRFSFLKIASPAFRVFIYDRGDWLSEQENTANRLAIDTLNNYTTLDFLPMLTAFTAEPVQTYTAVDNDLPHYPAFLGAPEYRPSSVPAPPCLPAGKRSCRGHPLSCQYGLFFTSGKMVSFSQIQRRLGQHQNHHRVRSWPPCALRFTGKYHAAKRRAHNRIQFHSPFQGF